MLLVLSLAVVSIKLGQNRDCLREATACNNRYFNFSCRSLIFWGMGVEEGGNSFKSPVEASYSRRLSSHRTTHPGVYIDIIRLLST